MQPPRGRGTAAGDGPEGAAGRPCSPPAPTPARAPTRAGRLQGAPPSTMRRAEKEAAAAVSAARRRAVAELLPCRLLKAAGRFHHTEPAPGAGTPRLARCGSPDGGGLPLGAGGLERAGPIGVF